jgi:hypothetical protein
MCPLSLVTIAVLPDHDLSESWYLTVLIAQVDASGDLMRNNFVWI